jgi:hypothetical protein
MTNVWKTKKRSSRCVELGERIITYKGERVVTPDYNYAENIGTGKVQCSCSSIVLFDGYKLHTKRLGCIRYHEITKTTPEIIHHIY